MTVKKSQARWQFEPSAGGKSMNISQVDPSVKMKVKCSQLFFQLRANFWQKTNLTQISYEWPATFLDVVEWKQHEKKSGVFFHEEGVFSLWTMKVVSCQYCFSS